MGPSIEITPELLAGFLDEAPEYLEMLDEGLMEFESKAGAGSISMEDAEDEERMNVMFRAAHSLKGLAAAFGFENIKELTHRMETLFDQVRMRKRDLSAQSFEILFRVFDRLKALVAELSEPGDEPVNIDDVLAALDDALEGRLEEGASASNRAGGAAESGDDATGESVAEVLGDPELAKLFIDTTIESLDELSEGLLGLEHEPSSEKLLNEVFRAAHNVKGASGAVGLSGMQALTHDMETILDELRSGTRILTDELTSALLDATDRLRDVVDGIARGAAQDVSLIEAQQTLKDALEREASVSDIDALTAEAQAGSNPDETADLACDSDAGAAAGRQKIEAADGQLDESTVDAATGDVGAESREAAASIGSVGAAALEESSPAEDNGASGVMEVYVRFPQGFEEAAIQAYLIFNKLESAGDVIATRPDIETVAGDADISEIVYTLRSEVPQEQVRRMVTGFGVESLRVCQAGTCHELDVPSLGRTGEAKTPAAQPVDATDANSPAGATAATPPKSAPPASAAEKLQARADKVVKTSETLRVDQERLDELMNLGGELVINRARFVEIHGKLREVFEGKNVSFALDDMAERLHGLTARMDAAAEAATLSREDDHLRGNLRHLEDSFQIVRGVMEQVQEARAMMHEFDEAVHGLSRVTDGIQKGIMGTRMVPIGPLFARFRRVVRDISKSTGKEVELVLRGETTELDKRMIDELGDPLTHMVRNSVDHGIEPPDVREKNGKPRTAKVILEASHRGNSICIDVIDDGAGVNVERVKAKILERELATPAQVEAMTEREICQYIFKPGFSTAQVVTDLSGRGMGMDIVVSKIEALSGTVEVDSKTGEGAKVTIKLPLTLAILTSMVARIGDGVYALPLETVAEIITVRRSDIQYIQKRPVVRVRDRVIPVTQFESIFDTSLPGLQTKTRSADDLTLVIVGFENEKMGLVVDALLGQEDIVIKSIAENYRNIRGVAGASIRGDGSVSLILDVGAMMEMATTAATAGAGAIPSGSSPQLAAAANGKGVAQNGAGTQEPGEEDAQCTRPQEVATV